MNMQSNPLARRQRLGSTEMNTNSSKNKKINRFSDTVKVNRLARQFSKKLITRTNRPQKNNISKIGAHNSLHTQASTLKIACFLISLVLSCFLMSILHSATELSLAQFIQTRLISQSKYEHSRSNIFECDEQDAMVDWLSRYTVHTLFGKPSKEGKSNFLFYEPKDDALSMITRERCSQLQKKTRQVFRLIPNTRSVYVMDGLLVRQKRGHVRGNTFEETTR